MSVLSLVIAPLLLQVKILLTCVNEPLTVLIDWVAALFRRVIALYENLPEEGGRRNTTGGKQEESVLKSIKAMMDVVCLHMSDQLFDLILNMAFDYASTNSKSNAVRAFGQFVACLARVRPEQTLAKFLPFCMAQVEEELLHGASSIRTTAPTAAVPSDTTFHWSTPSLRIGSCVTDLLCRSSHTARLFGIRRTSGT